jgi:serine/threonine-protein kinase
VPPGETQIEHLLVAILDGTPIDWAAAEASSGPGQPLLRQLQILAAIAALHRDLEPEKLALWQGTPAGGSQTSGPPPLVWGHLQLLDRIGHGSFGEVYRAWDPRLHREVALKLLPAGPPAEAQAASVLMDEGRLLAKVRHPNVVTIFGAEQIADRIGLWMELVRGQTLEQLLSEAKVVSATDAIAIGVELCRAVSAVHAAGLLHRDIKTHNVMRAEDGRIVLMDLGTGRERDDQASSDLAGTPLYLAPEVLNGGQATVQSEIYSLGVLLYHLLTGSYPVHARTVGAVRRAHARGERTAVRTARSDVPRKLARIIERAMDPDPRRRYRSVEAFGSALQALVPRTGAARLAYAAGSAATFMLVAATGWEVTGRQAGFPEPPSALLTRFAAAYGAGSVTISPVERPVIAVLPFKTLSVHSGTDAVVDTLTEDIIRDLAVVSGLHVRSRTSSFEFKDEPRNLQAIADTLGANLIVEGSAEREGNNLRIIARLVRIDGDVPLWAEQFDGELEDVFSIREEISRAVVKRLGLAPGKGHRRSITQMGAYELYLEAHALLDRRGFQNAQKAIELFERVIARDDRFAPAHAGLTTAHAFASFPFRGQPFAKAYPVMRRAAVKALQLDPELAEAHAAMGWVYAYEHDWPNAEKAFRRSIDRDPSLTQAYTSYSISTLGPLERYDEALELLRVAAQHDPLSLDVQREVGEVQLFSGRYAQAVETFQRIIEREPDFPFAYTYLAIALMHTGRVTEAFPLLEPGYPALAVAYVMTGRRAEAQRLAAQWEGYPFHLAIIAGALGETERALAALEQAAATEPHRMGRLFIQPELAAFRSDPRFQALRKRFGLR